MPSGPLEAEKRILIDEDSFRFLGVEASLAEEAVDNFNDLLSEALGQGLTIQKSAFWFDIELDSGLPLYAVLYEKGTRIDPDTLRRLSVLIDRCAEWPDDVGEFSTIAKVAEAEVDSWPIGYAHARASLGRYTGLLALGLAGRRGAQAVVVESSEAEIFFLVDLSDLPLFWQRLLQVEEIIQDDFFTSCPLAFPSLYLHLDLDFRKFKGSYQDVYHWVVQTLMILNNSFAEVFQEENGVRHEIQGRIKSLGIDISPESVRTRSRDELMKLRVVTVESGEEIKCEWHSKRLYDVDRIHFSAPEASVDGRIVVGIFTDHLPV